MSKNRPTTSTAGDHPHESLRETIDSILVALILAFVFRAFVVEAFVIPTGSMAPTLSGAHGTIVCDNCGWEFTYGLVDTANAPQHAAIRQATDAGIECPNCRYVNRNLQITNARGNYESGDRILVLKWPFDIGGPLLGPQRWQVVVFKDPSDGVTNYIKRLAGMPDEVLELLDGDVYRAGRATLSEDALATLAALRRIKYWRTQHSRRLRNANRRPGEPPLVVDDDVPSLREIERQQAQLSSRRNALLEELDHKLHIVHKSGLAQQSLWSVVYDHDFPPREMGFRQPRWAPASADNGWSVGHRTMHCVPGGGKEAFVELHAVIDSHCSYNAPNTGPPPYPVSDLRVSFVATVNEDDDGALGVRLRKDDDVFLGEVHLDGVVKLSHRVAGSRSEWQPFGEARVNTDLLHRPFEFAMANLDHRVTVCIGGQQVLSTTDDQYAPDIAALRRRTSTTAFAPAIFARSLDVVLQHVLVQKDVYYVSDVPRAASPLQYEAWGTRNHPIELLPGEYFFLGDNSAQSKDSRLWDVAGNHLASRGEGYQLGTVPRDQLIGRAFFVYWPSGLRTKLIPAMQDIGWIPNFGRMRWIR